MMKWEKLTEKPSFLVQRGNLFRFHASLPFENEVVMMVCEVYGSYAEMGMLTITGSKAGISYFVIFPKSEIGNELSSDWLIKNWKNWVCPEGSVEDVYFCDQLVTADLGSL